MSKTNNPHTRRGGKKYNFRYKPGPWSANELAQLRELGAQMTPEQLAKRLRRREEDVRARVSQVLGIKTAEMVSLTQALEGRPEWRQISRQFSQDEQEEFKHQYVQLMAQFKDDIKPTEELQVFQVIQLKIQIDRILVEQKMALEDMADAHEEIKQLEDDLRDAKGAAAKVSIKEELSDKWGKYMSAKKSNNDCADRYKIYSDKQDKMFASLKATRDQRVKFFDDSHQSFLGFLRLLADEDQRLRLGDEMELMNIAAQKERARLMSPHKYEDGTEDCPLLVPNEDDDESNEGD